MPSSISNVIRHTTVWDIGDIKNSFVGTIVCIKAPYHRRFLGRVGRTPYRVHSLGDGSKCHHGKGLKTVCIAPARTSDRKASLILCRAEDPINPGHDQVLLIISPSVHPT